MDIIAPFKGASHISLSPFVKEKWVCADDDGVHPVHLSVHFPEMLCAFSPSSPCWSEVDKNGNNFMHYFAKGTQKDYFEEFFERLKSRIEDVIDQKNVEGDTPLHILGDYSNFQVATVLFGKNCKGFLRVALSRDINATDSDQNHCLQRLLLAKNRTEITDSTHVLECVKGFFDIFTLIFGRIYKTWRRHQSPKCVGNDCSSHRRTATIAFRIDVVVGV